MGKILLCDDEDSLCRSLGRILRSAGHEVVALDGVQGYARLKQERFDLILTDIRMPDVSGFEILAAARVHAPGTPVIAMSGSAEIPDAVRAMHAGARDFLIKPFEVRTLEEAVAAVLQADAAPREPETDALRVARPARALAAGQRSRAAPCSVDAGEGRRHAMHGADHRRVGHRQGAGRAFAARRFGARQADRSWRSTAPPSRPTWSSPSCSATRAASFTGATSSRIGRFAQADTGTILLDEIGEMEPAVQAKLLRLIQDGELYPVGEETPTRVDVRILAATNRNLETRGRERPLPRRSVLAPQRHPRRVAVAARAPRRHHAAGGALPGERQRQHKRGVAGFDPQVTGLFKAYNWPGNIRELENVVERLVIIKGAALIGVADLPRQIRTPRRVDAQGDADATSCPRTAPTCARCWRRSRRA